MVSILEGLALALTLLSYFERLAGRVRIPEGGPIGLQAPEIAEFFEPEPPAYGGAGPPSTASRPLTKKPPRDCST